MFKKRISPGLDIQGGLRLMYEVEVDEAVRDRRDLRADQLQRQIGERLDLIPKDQTWRALRPISVPRSRGSAASA